MSHKLALHINFLASAETASLNLCSFFCSSTDFHFNTISMEFRKAVRFHSKCTIITIWLACASMPVSEHFNFQPSEWHNRNAPKYQLNRSHQLRFAQSVSFSLPSRSTAFCSLYGRPPPVSVPVLSRLGRTLTGCAAVFSPLRSDTES